LSGKSLIEPYSLFRIVETFAENLDIRQKNPLFGEALVKPLSGVLGANVLGGRYDGRLWH
jgi:hypothetical protein